MFRTNSTRFLLPLTVLLALVACKPQGSPDTAADKAALETAAEGWVKAYNDKNADVLATIYSEDGQLLPPGPAAVNGRAAIKDYWANDIANAWAPISIKTDSSDVGGDWAWRAGTWSMEAPASVKGKYVEVWHRTAEGWKLHRDVWNVDDAPAAAPPADAAAPPAPPPAQ